MVLPSSSTPAYKVILRIFGFLSVFHSYISSFLKGWEEGLTFMDQIRSFALKFSEWEKIRG